MSWFTRVGKCILYLSGDQMFSHRYEYMTLLNLQGYLAGLHLAGPNEYSIPCTDVKTGVRFRSSINNYINGMPVKG